MPIYNWNKVIEKGDYSFVSKDCVLINGAEEAFANLYNEYLDTFGINPTLLDIVELQNEITLYKIDIALGQKSLTALLHLAEFKLKQKLESKQTNTNDAIIHVEKYMGFAIDEHKTTVLKYYKYLKALENGR